MKEFELFESEAVRKWIDPKAKKSPEEIKKDAAKAIFTDFDKEYTAQKAAQDELPPKAPLVGPDGGSGEVTRKGGQGFSPDAGTGLKSKEQPFIGQYPNSPLKVFQYADELGGGEGIANNQYFQDVITNQEMGARDVMNAVEKVIGFQPVDEEEDNFEDLYDAWQERLNNFADEHGNDSSTAGFSSGGGIKIRELFDDFAFEGSNFTKLMRDYTNKGFMNLNDFLRFGRTGDYDDETLREVISYLTTMGNWNVNYGDVFRGDHKNRLKGLHIGDIIRDPGFTSTSLDEYVAKDFFSGWDGQTMRIRDAFGHEVTSDETLLALGDEEREIILPPNQLLRFMGEEDKMYNFEAIEKSDYDDKEWGYLMDRKDEDGDDLEEQRRPLVRRKLTQAFKDRMNSFNFEVINPGKKKFEEFYL